MLNNRMMLWMLLMAAMLLGTRAVAEKRPVTTSDVLRLKTMSQLQIAPDGRRVVFVLTSMGKNSNGEYRYFRHLYLVALEAKRPPVQLTFGERSDSSPVWSPDGQRIAFVRRHGKKPQIWILPLTGGEAYRVTDARFGASRPRWSPDGTKILFTSQVPEWAIEGEPPWPYERPGRQWRDMPNWKSLKPSQQDSLAARPDGSLQDIRAWLAKNAADHNPRVFTRLNLQGEHELQPELKFTHVFVVRAEPDARAEQLTHGFQNFQNPEWSPDGRFIICSSVRFTQHPDRTRDSDLWRIDVAQKRAEPFLNWRGYLVSQPKYTPDGKTIVFIATDSTRMGYAQRHLAKIAADGGQPQWLTQTLDRSVFNHRFSPDGRYVYFVAANEGDFPLYRVPVRGGAVETLIAGDRGVRDYAVGRKHLLVALTEVRNPYELYRADHRGRHLERLSDFNERWVRERIVTFPEEHWLTRPDGRRVQYWIMKPVGWKPGVRYPLVVEIHGGPSAMWGPGEFTMWHEFQLMTAWGYGVVFCNPRGSGGYGYEFQHANYQNWGEGPASDILAVADTAAKLDWVDADQLFVTGGSYAGYMTAWIVSQDHRFKAAVAQRGVYDLSVFFGEGRAWRLIPNHFGGYPWDADVRRILDANSPQTFVENIRTPLLIMHADRDRRTGVIQSEYLYKSLKALGRPVEYVRYPNEGHDLSRSGNPYRRMDRLNRIIEFFERYVRHPEPPPATK